MTARFIAPNAVSISQKLPMIGANNAVRERTVPNVRKRMTGIVASAVFVPRAKELKAARIADCAKSAA